jgi:hypothetical protein
MDCVCVPFRGRIGKTKDFSVLVVGARRTGWFVSRTAMLLGFSASTEKKEWSTTQRTSSQFGTTVGSICVKYVHIFGTAAADQ